MREREGVRSGGREGGKQGERERNMDLLPHLFMHSLVVSRMCPDWGRNCSLGLGTMLYQLSYPAKVPLYFCQCSISSIKKPKKVSFSKISFFPVPFTAVSSIVFDVLVSVRTQQNFTGICSLAVLKHFKNNVTFIVCDS